MHLPTPFAPLALLVAASGLAACGGPPGSSQPGAEPTGQTTLAITSVPSGVQCIQVTATGSSTVAQSFSVSAGASSVGLSLGELPLGSVVFTGQAFNVACAGITGVAPTYVAGAQTATLEPGVVSNLTMTFRRDNPVGVTASFVGNIVNVAVTPGATYYVMSDGTVEASGVSLAASSSTVAPVSGLTSIVEIAAGSESTCALSSTGSVSCWGQNYYGELGNGTTVASATPVAVQGITTAVHIAVGLFHACALLQNSSISCWGYNTDGELGNGTTTNSLTPVTVSLGSPFGASIAVTQISAGASSTCALQASGNVWCWGDNAYGQLGNGNTTSSDYPVQVSATINPTLGIGVEAISQIAVGYSHACAVRTDGTVRCWGYNADGQLGNGSTTNSSNPVLASVTGITQIAATSWSTCAKSASSTFCWGFNQDGELGNGTGVAAYAPVSVTGLGPSMSLGSSWAASGFCSVMPDTSVECWGGNTQGQLGNGSLVDSFVPTAVKM